MPDAPPQVAANGSGSTPASPVQIAANGSAGSPASPLQISANGSGSTPAAPPDVTLIAASFAPRAIRISGALVPDAAATVVLAGEHDGRPCYTTGGSPNLQEGAAEPDGDLPEEGRWVVLYWSQVDTAWLIEVWQDGALESGGAWSSESDVISPDFAASWSAAGTFTGTPVVSSNLDPEPISPDSTPPLPPGSVVVTGDLSPDSTGVYLLSGTQEGRPRYSTDGATSPPPAGLWGRIYSTTPPLTWVHDFWEDGVLAGRWTSLEEVATPDLVGEWTEDSGTGFVIVTAAEGGPASPVQIAGNGSSGTPAAAPQIASNGTAATPAAPPAIV